MAAAQAVADVLNFRTRQKPQRVGPTVAAKSDRPVVAAELKASGKKQARAVAAAAGNDLAKVRRHLAERLLQHLDALAFIAGERIGAHHILQHRDRSDAERGEDGQRQQHFNEGKSASSLDHGGVT